MNQLLSVFATRMRDRRRTLGITQEELAEKSGLSANYVGKLEIGYSIPSVNSLICLAEALEIEVYELLIASCERPWVGATLEIERIMESLGEQDAEFMLHEFQNIAGYLKSRKNTN